MKDNHTLTLKSMNAKSEDETRIKALEEAAQLAEAMYAYGVARAIRALQDKPVTAATS